MATVNPTLQQQGVPWPSRLGSRRKSQPVIRNQYIRTREKTPSGGSRTVTTHYAAPAQERRAARSNVPVTRRYNPVNAGEATAGSAGMLEAEFLICLVLLGLLMFANSTSSYGEKIMSTMKRGTLICLLFFLLAIISNVGPNAAKIAKTFGALVIVAILITTPINTVVTDVDNLIKNDWVGTSETGGDTTSADAGTSAGESAAVAEANKLGLPGSVAALIPSDILAKIGSGSESAYNAIEGWLNSSGNSITNGVKSILHGLGL